MTALAGQRGISRPALITFLVLGILLSWYPWFFALAQGKTTGPNPLGLFLAALIASAVDGGWRGPVSLLVRIARPRGPALVWLAAILVPALALAITAGVARYRGIAIDLPAPNWTALADQFLITFLFVALGEEPAWRGFLLPMLQRRLHPFIATLAVAAVWAPWHIPLFGSEFTPDIIPMFLVSLLGGALVLSWLYNATQWILPGMICHALINTLGAGFVFQGVAAEAIAQFWWIYALTWLGLGLAVTLLTAGRLGAR